MAARMAKRGYHHGNLKQALVETALEMITERGPLALSITEAAKRLGVSPAAPYRHFSSKDELIEEAARQGYEIFADLLEFAHDGGQPSALSSFEATCRAYLAFARKFPGHYIAMFESGVSVNASPPLAHAAQRAKSVVEKATTSLVAGLDRSGVPPATMIGDHIWAISHGVVELYSRGPEGLRSQFSPEELLETGIGIYLRGLGVVESDRN